MGDRYDIKGRLGRGGVGAVYRAYDRQLKREVAIKRLLPREQTKLHEGSNVTLENEARALAALSHPNVVTIHEFSEDDQGAYVVCELIDGDTLQEIIENGDLSESDFFEVADQILETMKISFPSPLPGSSLSDREGSPFKTVPYRMKRFSVALLGCLLAFATGAAEEEEPAYEPAKFFRTQILPILEKRCFECHSEKEGSADGGLVLDTKAGWIRGGDHGPAVVPYNLGKSSLIRTVRSDDTANKMPPEGKLSRGEIALLSTWVLLGAPDPRPDGDSNGP